MTKKKSPAPLEAAVDARPRFRVRNRLVSVRESTDRRDPGYFRFREWRRGEVMEDWPEHTDIEGLLAAGHIEPIGGE